MAQTETKTLKAFLRESVIEKQPIKYPASKRIKDAEGNPIEWEIKSIDNKRLDKLTKRHTKRVPIKGTKDYNTETDGKALQMDLTIECVVFPNLNDSELQESWDCVGAEDLLNAMLTPGELADLHLAVLEANDIEAGMEAEIKK